MNIRISVIAMLVVLLTTFSSIDASAQVRHHRTTTTTTVTDGNGNRVNRVYRSDNGRRRHGYSNRRSTVVVRDGNYHRRGYNRGYNRSYRRSTYHRHGRPHRATVIIR